MMKFYAEQMLAVPLLVICISFAGAQSTDADTDTPGTCQLNAYPVYDVRNCHEQQRYGTDDAVRRLARSSTRAWFRQSPESRHGTSSSVQLLNMQSDRGWTVHDS